MNRNDSWTPYFFINVSSSDPSDGIELQPRNWDAEARACRISIL